MIGNVGAGQHIRISGEHSGDVECDVAVADDDHPLVAQVHRQIGELGVPVDPGHHLGGGPGAGQIHAVDVEPAVVGRADGIQHGVMMLQQVRVRQVLADLDVEEELEPRLLGDDVEQPRHPLGALVVRRHAGAHQSVGRRQLLEDVHPHAALGQQLVGRVHGGRTRPHDGDRQRPTGPCRHVGRRDHRGQLRGRRQLAFPLRVEGRVQLDER